MLSQVKSSQRGSSHYKYCSQHHNERLTLYCESCDILNCRDCQLSERHRNCKYRFIHFFIYYFTYLCIFAFMHSCNSFIAEFICSYVHMFILSFSLYSLNCLYSLYSLYSLIILKSCSIIVL